ncbi:hypothetical protein ACFQ9H_19295 [Streptomyces sp. NPDC056517]|uniref:hypothetical protein n=1 Tax=Streptomyces sp. NPDC056517 TaxID=3345848 RepID=UPI003695B79E
MKHAELLAAARRVLWQTWNSSSEEIGASGAQGLLDAGMLVEAGGAGELERLRARVAELESTPADLTEPDVDGAGRTHAEYYPTQAPDVPGPVGDPIAYCPTGISCGCGKDAHSNLVPCEPAPAEDPSRSRGASEIKHPVMRPTRDHLAENPLPEQKRKDSAA